MTAILHNLAYPFLTVFALMGAGVILGMHHQTQEYEPLMAKARESIVHSSRLLQQMEMSLATCSAQNTALLSRMRKQK